MKTRLPPNASGRLESKAKVESTATATSSMLGDKENLRAHLRAIDAPYFHVLYQEAYKSSSLLGSTSIAYSQEPHASLLSLPPGNSPFKLLLRVRGEYQASSPCVSSVRRRWHRNRR